MATFPNITFNFSLPNSTVNGSVLHNHSHGRNARGESPETFEISLVNVTYVSLLAGIIFFALLGNLLVILVFMLDKRLRISSSFYMLSLAVSDIITASLVMPLEVDQLLSNYNWRHSRALCQMWTTAYLFTVPVSILTACASSIDRWYAISKPLQYRTGRMGMKHKALCAIIIVWVYSLLFAFIPKMGWNPPGMAGFPDDLSKCYFDIELEYSILSSVLNFILPSLITAFFYRHMFTSMEKHKKKRRKLSSASDYTNRSPSHRSERKTFMGNVRIAKSYALIGSLLIVTWFPFTIFSVVQNICYLTTTTFCAATAKVNPRVQFSLLVLGYFNSALNPVVYVLRFRAFRLTIRDWLTCKKRCVKSQLARSTWK